jgi:hypothetical protein
LLEREVCMGFGCKEARGRLGDVVGGGVKVPEDMMPGFLGISGC